MAADGAIRVEGVRELTRALTRINPEIGKEIGKRNKAIGERVISAVFPKPESVGAGAGSKPRAIASRNMVAIAAGGGHRQKVPVQQWGRVHVARAQPRPFILGAALAEIPDIEKEYLDAIDSAVRSFGLD